MKCKFFFNNLKSLKLKKKLKKFFLVKKIFEKKKNFLWNSTKKPEIPLFAPKNGLSAFYPIPHSTKFKNIPWNSARGIRFLPPSHCYKINLSLLLVFHSTILTQASVNLMIILERFQLYNMVPTVVRI